MGSRFRDILAFLADAITIASFFSGSITLKWFVLVRPRPGDVISLMNWASILGNIAFAMLGAVIGTWAAGGRRRTYKRRAFVGVAGLLFVLVAIYFGLYQYWPNLVVYSQNPPPEDAPEWLAMAQELTFLFTVANGAATVGLVLLLVASVGLYPYHR